MAKGASAEKTVREIRAVVPLGKTLPSAEICEAIERADYPYDYRIAR